MAAGTGRRASSRVRRTRDDAVPMVSRSVLNGLEEIRGDMLHKPHSRNVVQALAWIKRLSDLQRGEPEPGCKGPT